MDVIPTRYGITVPFDGVPLHAQRDWFEECADLGYTDFWSSEVDGTDGLTPLVLASTWAPTVRLGQAILPVYLRGPALLAQSVAALCEAAPGRVAIGVGASSNVIVERWNGLPFDKPYQRVRDTVRFLKAALAGEKVTHRYETFAVDGFKLGRPLANADVPPPPVLVAALRPGMLRLAGREADGAIVNWLGADDVKTVVPHVGEPGTKEIVCRIFCAPGIDKDTARAAGRFAVAAYLNVPVYAAFHEWLGRGELLRPMWDAWKAGDRKAALEAIPDEVVDDLVVSGTPEECREHIRRYIDNGVTTTALAILPLPGVDARQATRDLAPIPRG